MVHALRRLEQARLDAVKLMIHHQQLLLNLGALCKALQQSLQRSHEQVPRRLSSIVFVNQKQNPNGFVCSEKRDLQSDGGQEKASAIERLVDSPSLLSIIRPNDLVSELQCPHLPHDEAGSRCKHAVVMKELMSLQCVQDQNPTVMITFADLKLGPSNLMIDAHVTARRHSMDAPRHSQTTPVAHLRGFALKLSHVPGLRTR